MGWVHWEVWAGHRHETGASGKNLAARGLAARAVLGDYTVLCGAAAAVWGWATGALERCNTKILALLAGLAVQAAAGGDRADSSAGN